ncbi:MAG: cytochrome c-type biogenesis protein CcmH [Caulobacteraceae bacterium]|nr:cytochrome c-type biogenesis protein CcmH [Caulobacter sp.]
MRRSLRLAAAFAALALAPVARAQPQAPPLGVERLADPAQEARAHAVFRQIRCVVCQNESIDDSEAPLAGDLRHIVRAQVAAGRSDAEIRRFLVDRYGQFVLLKPRFDAGNALLWLGPFALVAAGLGGALLARRGVRSAPGLTPGEAARLEALRRPE